MSTKSKRAAELAAEREAVRAKKAALLHEISNSNAPEYSTVLKSLSYNDVEVWNFVTCRIQNAEEDKNELVSSFECALASESEEVQAYFLALGFSF